MFQQNANAACNNTVFLVGTIPDMEEEDTGGELHPSAQRLYLAAKTMRATEGKSNLARLLNESPQMVNNWAARGVSVPGALKAQVLIGCDANWLLTGQGGMLAGWPFSALLKGAVSDLDGRSLARLENAMRVQLDMPPLPGPSSPPSLGVIKNPAADIEHPPEFSVPRRKQPPKKKAG